MLHQLAPNRMRTVIDALTDRLTANSPANPLPILRDPDDPTCCEVDTARILTDAGVPALPDGIDVTIAVTPPHPDHCVAPTPEQTRIEVVFTAPDTPGYPEYRVNVYGGRNPLYADVTPGPVADVALTAMDVIDALYDGVAVQDVVFDDEQATWLTPDVVHVHARFDGEPADTVIRFTQPQP